ncbi:MAG: dethiobiotin synthase [Planctomycetaceae bacterium]|nr:dethiobiotin synthase [Planctomycetaceae bacterium]
MSCRGVFVTGTDTGVGKTRVAAAIVRLLREQGIKVGAYKPTASGSEPGPNGPVWRDVDELCAALGGEFASAAVCPQRWRAALAPPVAARDEGGVVDGRLLRQGAAWWRERVDFLVVEGAGGLLSPLTDTETVADLALDLGFPLVVVARLSLGTINHTLLTLEAAQTRQLPVAGVILNQAVPPDPADRSWQTNPTELARRTSLPIMAVFPYDPAADLLRTAAFRRIDFAGLSATKF